MQFVSNTLNYLDVVLSYSYRARRTIPYLDSHVMSSYFMSRYVCVMSCDPLPLSPRPWLFLFVAVVGCSQAVIRSNELLLFPTTPDVLSIVPAVQEKVYPTYLYYQTMNHASTTWVLYFIVLPQVSPSARDDRHDALGVWTGKTSEVGSAKTNCWLFAPFGPPWIRNVGLLLSGQHKVDARARKAAGERGMRETFEVPYLCGTCRYHLLFTMVMVSVVFRRLSFLSFSGGGACLMTPYWLILINPSNVCCVCAASSRSG